jgi:hypothetical protein
MSLSAAQFNGYRRQLTASTVAQYLAALPADRRAALSAVVGRTVARVSAEEHIATYKAMRALLGKGKRAKPKK